MIIKINDDRGFETQTLYSGYLEENNSLTLEFEIPEYLEKYNKKANFELKEGTKVCKLFDEITSNKLTLTRDLLKFNKLQMAIEFFDTEENLIYRTSILTIIISDSIICDDDVSPEDSKVVILNELIQKVNELNTEITENESKRESNEQTRISNEDTRVANETARQEYVTQLKKDVELGNFDGATFTPQINENGDLSWSNNKGLVNPQTINIRGPEGKEGKKGEQGEPFRISKTYPSVEAMQSDFENMPIDSYVMIATSIEIEDNAKLYYRAETEWVYITDFSGAIGIQGPKGDDGDTGAKGEQGEPGVGISKLEVIDGALYVTLTNNVKENAGVILTDEVKAWLVSQITDNAESDFNTYYNSKVEEFNTNATEKTTAYNDNASEKLSEYNTNATNKISEYNSNAEAILKILPKTETEVQENIDIDDAGESSFNKLRVFGNSRQSSTEGYNLLNNILESQTVNGVTVTVNEDKSITLNGTSTGAITLNYTNDFGTINSDYIFYLIGKNNKINLQGVENEETVAYLAFSNNNNNVKKNYETDTIITRVFSYISAGTTFNNETFYPMITKGIEEKPYEPFTGGNPSPNPDFPQEIKSVGRKSKNILDISDLYTESTINGVNVKYNNDGTLTLNGTATGHVHLALRSSGNLENGDYSFKNFGSPSNIATNIYYVGDVYGEDVRHFTVTEEHNYAIVYVIPLGTTINTTIKPMLVKGTYDDTNFPEFEPYTENLIIKFKRTGKNLNKYPYFDDDTHSEGGITYTVQDDYGIKLEGTSTGESYYDMHKGYKIKKGTYKASVKGLTKIIRLSIVPYLKDGSHLEPIIFDINNSIKDLILEEDVELNSYIFLVAGVNANTIVYLQIEKGSEATEYEPYHEDVYTLPVQQEMLEKDTFEKVDGNWYEVHNRTFYECTGEENWLREEINSSGKYRYGFYNYPLGTAKNKYDKSICTHFKNFNQYGVIDNTFGIENSSIRFNFNPLKTFNSADEFKNWLVEQKNGGTPVRIYYYLETPTKLPCTPEQVEVLNQLEQFSLSKGINHIFSDDELSPKFQLKYYQDMNILLDKINKNIADVSAEII